jgi:transcriptional regulator with XRE-family HTH domain
MCKVKNDKGEVNSTEEPEEQLDMVAIGKRIRAARKERKFSQEQLAEQCQCTATHISNLENGKGQMSLKLLCKFSFVLDYLMDYFMMDDPRVSMKLRVELELVEKLEKLNPQMVNLFSTLLDLLIELQSLSRKD